MKKKPQQQQPTNPMQVVTGLLLERQRYEAWLAALEAKRAITPPHVFERVRADYGRRLEQVLEQLLGRTAELKQTVSVLTMRLATLQAEETAARDRRHESELRAAVGEMAAAEWDQVRRSADEEISRLGAERSAITSELARVQQILTMAHKEEGAGAAAEEAESEELEVEEEPEQERGFDELAFLKSVVETHHGLQQESGGPPAPGKRSGTSPQSATRQSPPNVSALKKPSSGRASRAQEPPAATPTGPTDDDEEGEIPSFLRDVPSEEVRTLKCSECSAMNYPTEWYCERCGAELAGL